MALAAASVAAMLWCAFCIADLGFMFYTEEWFYYLTDDQQQSAYRCLLRRVSMAVGPLLLTNVAGVLLLRAALRRRPTS